MEDHPQNSLRTRFSRVAVAAVLGGATGIGFAPILVRLSQIGPSATASFRILLALPLLWMFVKLERSRNGSAARPFVARDYAMLSVTGLFFTADLSIWHWSLQFTSVANSTLLTNFAPIFVTLGARVFLREKISALFRAGMLLAFSGAVMLVCESLNFSLKNLFGDALAVFGAIFYAGYLLSVKFLRRSFSTLSIMAWSGLVSCPALFLLGLLSGEKLLPVNERGWAVLLGLALLSHVGGQTLIAYALGHLPASFSALGLLWQPVMAGLLAWAVLHEPLTLLQGIGGMIVLMGIALASQSRLLAPPGSAGETAAVV